MGRKKVYGITLMVMVICSIASVLSFGKEPKAVMATLCFFRFWLGFGIGGDYPLSTTIMSEYANKKTRGTFIATVFVMQGFGIFEMQDDHDELLPAVLIINPFFIFLHDE
ncbi:Inorganic phosphate transporter 1-4 [Linum perenne]